MNAGRTRFRQDGGTVNQTFGDISLTVKGATRQSRRSALSAVDSSAVRRRGAII
jgi:hypothetical protein